MSVVRSIVALVEVDCVWAWELAASKGADPTDEVAGSEGADPMEEFAASEEGEAD